MLFLVTKNEFELQKMYAEHQPYQEIPSNEVVRQASTETCLGTPRNRSAVCEQVGACMQLESFHYGSIV